MLSALPLVSVFVAGVAAATPRPGAHAVTAPAAQALLAESLADADSIDSIHVSQRSITFAIDRAGEGFDLVASIDRSGNVLALAIIDTGRDRGRTSLGPLSWLADAITDTIAITRLEVAIDGRDLCPAGSTAAGRCGSIDRTVTIVTDDGERYLALPDRGPRSNAATAARWGAAWS